MALKLQWRLNYSKYGQERIRTKKILVNIRSSASRGPQFKLIIAMPGTRVFIRLPQEDQFGPYICPENVDIVECAREALRSDSPRSSDHQAKLADCDLWVQLPEIPEEYKNKYVLVFVSAEGEKQHTVYVYVVWMKEETISLDEVGGFVCSVYGSSAFDKESLRFCEDTAEDQSPSERGKTIRNIDH